MQTATILRNLLRKKHTAQGDVKALWSCFLEELSKSKLDSMSLTLNLYDRGIEGFESLWNEYLNTETGEVLSKEEYLQKKDTLDFDFEQIYSPSLYLEEVRRLQKLASNFVAEGFDVVVYYDRRYQDQKSYPPYMTVSW